jgi:hypothetical protein
MMILKIIVLALIVLTLGFLFLLCGKTGPHPTVEVENPKKKKKKREKKNLGDLD